MIYYCEKCELYFPEEELIDILPDGGRFHNECKDEDINQMSEEEIIEELNNGK